MNPTKATTIARVLELRHLYKTGQAAYPTNKEQAKMTPLDAVCWQCALILEGKRDLLTGSQSKLDKANATGTGYINRGLTMSPADEAEPFLGKGYNACFGHTACCASVCVGAHTGQGRIPHSKVARLGRTIAMECFLDEFIRLLSFEIKIAELEALRIGMLLAMRLNVATDHWLLAERIAALFPSVLFYDYSAIPSAVRNQRRVQRVYSLKDGKDRMAKTLEILSQGYGAAVVFAISSRSKEPLPTTWKGYPVINGDQDDLWPTRKPESGPFIVGLKVKGTKAQVAQAIQKGFAVAA